MKHGGKRDIFLGHCGIRSCRLSKTAEIHSSLTRERNTGIQFHESKYTLGLQVPPQSITEARCL